MTDGRTAPRPHAGLRIGVTGHRAGKLPAHAGRELEAAVRSVLEAIARESRKAGGDEVSLVLVSSLADGVDMLAARLALDLGWTLECPLPFAQAHYERDFPDAASLQDFRELLARARTTFSVSADRPDHDKAADTHAYEAAGRVLVATSDLILAVWNGRPPDGPGGTADVVGNACQDGLPVVVVAPDGRAPPRILWTEFSRLPAHAISPDSLEADSRSADEALGLVVHALLARPQDKSSAALLSQFLKSRVPAVAVWTWYHVFLAAVAARRLHPNDLRPCLDIERELAEVRTGLPPESAGVLKDAFHGVLLPAFVFADRMAIFYAGLYRSAFFFNYMAAAAAVLLALAGLIFHDAKTKLVWFEFGIILLIVGNTRWGAVGGWHRRWLDYRRLAEMLRHARFAAWLGSGGRIRRPGLRGTSENEGWVDWYARLIRRQLPLPSAVADRSYLARVGEYLIARELEPQIAYHRESFRQMLHVNHVLHRIGTVCFALTALTCAGYLAAEWALGHDGISDRAKLMVTAATALLPTFGAAFSAIRVQGDFQMRAERSRETMRRLKRVSDVLKDELDGSRMSVALLSDRIDKAGLAIYSDLDEWQLLSETKPLGLPA